ncbi:hypothetical protein [Limibacillus sp. MBR-115]|jgi:uncharacterized protein YdaU (DUF1376 family)|uniref:hypothetical protein n=1 Tax=Limibacillus sp. MBR-115 TaxID=3156465 RepID=UPI00339B0F8D
MSEHRNQAPALVGSFNVWPDRWALETERLSFEEQGVYFALCLIAWRHPDTIVPIDDGRVSSGLRGCKNVRTYRRIRSRLIEEGKIFESGIGWEIPYVSERKRESFSAKNARKNRYKSLKNKETSSDALTHTQESPKTPLKVKCETLAQLPQEVRTCERFWRSIQPHHRSEVVQELARLQATHGAAAMATLVTAAASSIDASSPALWLRKNAPKHQ